MAYLVTAEVPAISREYVKVQVTSESSGAALDPTGWTVDLAMVPGGTPAAADWKQGSWESGGGNFFARLLIGPGTTQVLAPDRYGVWVRVNGPAEVPVMRAEGDLVVK